MTKEELIELSNKLHILSNKLTTSTNASLADTSLYLDNKEDTSRQECLKNDFKNIEKTLEEFKILTDQFKTLINI